MARKRKAFRAPELSHDDWDVVIKALEEARAFDLAARIAETIGYPATAACLRSEAARDGADA